MKTELFKISQVAKFLSITTTTLRYYESEGLLTPAYVDRETKYRYYDVNNINNVAYILALRDAGAGMRQIKDYFSNQSSMGGLLDELIEQQKKLQEKIKFLQDVFNSSKKEHAVKQITMPVIKYISHNHIAKDCQDVFNLVERFLNEAVTSTTLTSSPVVFIEYNTLDFASANFPIKIGIEVHCSKEKLKQRKSQKAIRTIHHGSYETLPLAYKALFAYALKNNLELCGNVFEYYFESFNLRLDPDDYVTEVIMPIK